MLGLGRALGETIAVALIISPIFEINLNWLHTGSKLGGIADCVAVRRGQRVGAGGAHGCWPVAIRPHLGRKHDRLADRVSVRSGRGLSCEYPTEIAGAQTTVHAVSTTSARVPERRRLTPNTTRREQVLLGACALSSFCLGWLLWTQLLPTQGCWLPRALVRELPAAVLPVHRAHRGSPARGRQGHHRDRHEWCRRPAGSARVDHRLHRGPGIGGITATFFTQDLATTGTLDSGAGSRTHSLERSSKSQSRS